MSEAIIIILSLLLLISLAVNFIAITIARTTDKWNERLLYKRIVNNARRKVQGGKSRAFIKLYDELVVDFEKLERQPRITKSENGVMTITEPFLNDVEMPMLKSGDIIVGERVWFKSRKRFD